MVRSLVPWILFLILLSILSQVPSFDFDESLYRILAESAKNDPWSMKWGNTDVFHKPPLLYWLMAFFSKLLDGASPAIGIFASRLPSLLSSLGIAILIAKKQSKENSFISAAPVFTLGLFPVLTAGAVLFDPLQSIFLTFVLLNLQKYVSEQMGPKNWAWLSVFTFLATATKGLNGLLIPFATVFFWEIFKAYQCRKIHFSRIWKLVGFYFAPTLILSFAYFALLDLKIGPNFTQEFFWVQHFGRATSAMEDHSAGIWFHPFVLWFGGGLLSALLIRLIANRKQKWTPEMVLAAAWIAVTVALFMFSKTALPHYTWPAWPAMALLLSNLIRDGESEFSRSGKFRFLEGLAALPLSAISVIFIFIGWKGPVALTKGIQLSERSRDIIQNLPPLENSLGWIIAGLIGFLILSLWRIVTVRFLISLHLVWVISIALVIPRSVYNMTQQPLVDLGLEAAARATSQDCLRYVGPLSATLDLQVGRKNFVNVCDTNQARFLIAPLWKKNECQENSMTLVSTKSYFVLCQREGSAN